MQEGRVSIAGQYHPLPRPFHVLATQNPLEQEGTYPLPEAQLDRFLLQIDVDYPDLDAERRMLIATTGLAETAAAAGDDRRGTAGRAAPGAAHSGRRQRGRRDPRAWSAPDGPDPAAAGPRRFVAWGPGPRASQALMLACRARALIDGRYAPSVDDVLALAPPVLRHRMAVSFAGRAEGISIGQVIDQMAMPLR